MLYRLIFTNAFFAMFLIVSNPLMAMNGEASKTLQKESKIADSCPGAPGGPDMKDVQNQAGPAIDQKTVDRALIQRLESILMDAIILDFRRFKARTRGEILSDDDQRELALICAEMRELINRGYDPNKIWASQHWMVDDEFLNFYFQTGANLNFCFKTGKEYTWIPLTKAIYDERRDLVESLVKAGADVNRRYVDGKGNETSPLAMALARNAAGIDNRGIIEFLKSKGAQ